MSSVSRMLEWPVMRQLFESVGQKLQSAVNEHDNFPSPRGLLESIASLPLDGIQSLGVPENTLRVPLHIAATRANLDLTSPALDWETMQRLSKCYFDAFNFLSPIMDRHWFNTDTLTSIINTGFEENTKSALVFLVLALGEVAMNSAGVPITSFKGRPSGIKGGTSDRPPGLAYFNEARKRMGFALTEVSVENVQMCALAALYYDSCGLAIVSGIHLRRPHRPLPLLLTTRQECWRMSVLASVACQALITRFERLMYCILAEN